MAGNSALLKHAPITTGCGLEIEALFRQAGFPENIFRALVIDNNMTEQVIHHPYISAVTLTGSNQTGKIVGAIAGSALKKIVLELGGSDAYIILEDADLDAAAEAVLTSRMNNAGQSCIAAKRILAVQPIRKQVQKILLDKLKRYQFGDPMDPAIQIGPLAREDLRAHLHEQVRTSVNQGAKILVGGIVPKGPGFYYPPTVLVEVKKGMPAYDEELFGPVITFIDAANEQEAVAIANGSQFGLSASIFTQNQKHGEAIALNALQAGTVFVNAFVRSDPRLPFGGIKGSGFGRELACEGIHEFVNIKTIGIA
jgi:succinate-semialdehyde dehydrogenase/glutarate-semialdehyde dehydrogenase